MNSDAGNTPSRALGSPIRTPSDHSSFGNSPRLIAAYYVLHRLLVPRHPPCALTHLQHKTIKDARVHCAVLKQHTPTPPTPQLQPGVSEISATRNNQTRRLDGVVSDTQQCVSSGPHSPTMPAPEANTSEITTRSCAIVFHPIEPPADPHSGPKPALTLTTKKVVSAP